MPVGQIMARALVCEKSAKWIERSRGGKNERKKEGEHNKNNDSVKWSNGACVSFTDVTAVPHVR